MKFKLSPQLTDRQLFKTKMMVACCAATTFINYVTAQSVNYYYGEEYDKVKIHQYPRGRIVEFTNGEDFCNR